MVKKSITGQSGPDLKRRVDELLQEARVKSDDAKRAVAAKFVPLLFAELIKQGFTPLEARSKIVEDSNVKF